MKLLITILSGFVIAFILLDILIRWLIDPTAPDSKDDKQ